MRTVVVYYSYTGKTELAARELAAILHADLRRIEDARYRGRLMTYLFGSIAALLGLGGRIKPAGMDLSSYGRVFLGTPVWADAPAPAVNTFIAAADLKGKEVVPFATMGSDKAGRALVRMMNRIRARGGTIRNSFAVKTVGLKDEAIIERIREIAQQFIDREVLQ